jgi:hypothetical protein
MLSSPLVIREGFRYLDVKPRSLSGYRLKTVKTITAAVSTERIWYRHSRDMILKYKSNGGMETSAHRKAILLTRCDLLRFIIALERLISIKVYAEY